MLCFIEPCFSDEFVVDREHYAKAFRFNAGHRFREYVKRNGLRSVFCELSTVGADARPLARELIHA